MQLRANKMLAIAGRSLTTAMRRSASFAAALSAAAAIVCLVACSPKPKYHIGDFLIPATAYEPSKIVMVVGVSGNSYKVFTHFLSDGKLLQAEDYKDLPRAEVDAGYIIVSAPRIEGVFSPERFISKKTSPNQNPDPR